MFRPSFDVNSLWLQLAVCFVVALLPCSSVSAQINPVAARYAKSEVRIPMRDGTTLFTVVYQPRDMSRPWPIMINRTPYSCQPYGANQYPGRVGPSALMEQEGYIFVKQDVRGRWMSEGQYDNMRPHVDGDLPIDESSDTYDTIEWLLQNVPNNNGKVGMWGISYPGFYTAAALAEHHPALVAASPQAPIADFYFDDFHHGGAFTLGYFMATNTFGFQSQGPTARQWYPEVRPNPVSAGQAGMPPGAPTTPAWNFYKALGPLSNADPYYGQNNFFWEQLSGHPDYDEFWQARDILPHLSDVKTNVMTVGGWFDAEDLYGPLKIYRSLEQKNPDAFNILVMGPWSHGDWANERIAFQTVGGVPFGRDLSSWYQTNIEAPFFRHFLKGEGNPPNFEALVFDTGKREWRAFTQWPPAESQVAQMFLRADGSLTGAAPAAGEQPFTEYVSDPDNPVPYRRMDKIDFGFTPRQYMAEDQRFAAGRADVLVFQTPVLDKDITLTGEVIANLKVSTTGTDADFIVKLIDVYPDTHPQLPGTSGDVRLAGCQQMVRSEALRGRYRNGFESSVPFVGGEVAEVNVTLQDVNHTFKAGHRLMIHVQSTWFPLIDRNPQTFVENIYEANAADFQAANHRIFHDPENSSRIEFRVLELAAPSGAGQ
ncbi:MAG: CocE/NonD family hydrolase [Planctomycetota bacterium]